MSKQIRNIIVFLLFIIVLILAIFMLKQPASPNGDKAQGTEMTSVSETAETLLGKVDYDSVKGITVTDAGEECIIVRNDKGFKIQNFNTDKMDLNKLIAVVSELTTATIRKNMGVQTDLGQFGLTASAVSITVNTENESKQFLVGNMLADDEDAVYILENDEVLAVDGFPMELLGGRKAFYRMELINIPNGVDENGNTVDMFEYLNFTGKKFDKPIKIVENKEVNSGYLMVEPVYAEAMLTETNRETKQVSLYDSLGILAADTVSVENYTETDLAQAGLDEPDAVAEFSLNGETHTISIGDSVDGLSYYMILDDDPNIYTVVNERVENWVDVKAMDLRATYVWLVPVNELSAVEVIMDDENNRYELSRAEDGETLTVTKSGREMEVDDVWLPYYQNLIGLTVMNIEEPENWQEKATLKIRYEYQAESNKEAVEVELHALNEAGSDRYAALLNGKFAGVVRKDTVDDIIQQTKEMIAE